MGKAHTYTIDDLIAVLRGYKGQYGNVNVYLHYGASGTLDVTPRVEPMEDNTRAVIL